MRILAVSFALATAILLGDLFIPLDVAGGVLYVVAVLATIWHTSRHAATVVASVSTGFLFLGGLLGMPLSYSLVDVVNRVLGLLAIWLTALLVQERKVAETALMTSELQVRSILDGTADAIVSLDEAGRVRSFNRAAGKIFGYEPSELAGRHLTSLTMGSYTSEVEEYIRDALTKRLNGNGREVVGLRKDGSTFPMHILLGDVSVAGFQQVTGILRDVTAQRQLEQELLAVTEEERSRVGYQLHEGLGQMLTGIGLITRSLYQKLRTERHPAADEALHIIEFLREADKYAKDLSQGLIPVDGDATGLTYALQRLASHVTEKFHVPCEFRQNGPAVVVDDHAMAAHLYQIAQEAVTMVARYERPRRIQLVLSRTAEGARVSIRHEEAACADCADEASLERWKKILSYRARVIGAILRIRRHQRGGSITCTVPAGSVASEYEAALAKPELVDDEQMTVVHESS